MIPQAKKKNAIDYQKQLSYLPEDDYDSFNSEEEEIPQKHKYIPEAMTSKHSWKQSNIYEFDESSASSLADVQEFDAKLGNGRKGLNGYFSKKNNDTLQNSSERNKRKLV